MFSSHRLSRMHPRSTFRPALCSTLIFIGCATPGTPKPPSLNLPEPVRDLSATRIGNTVELRYTLPTRSTDKLPLHGTSVTILFCREVDHQPCQPIPASKAVLPIDPANASNSHHTMLAWIDTLPADLTHGLPHTLGYRVAISNATGHSADNSAPAFTASGEPPAPIEDLHTVGSRLGIVLSWSPTSFQSGKVTVQRQDLAPAPAKQGSSRTSTTSPSGIVQLTAPASARSSSNLLDTTAHPDTPYRYTATRRITVPLDGRSIELLSAPSASIDQTLHTIYPPRAPAGLTTAGFFSSDTAATFAVDLIWQPVDEAGLISPLAGYNLYRETLVGLDHPLSPRTRLNTATLTLPSFHDTAADPHLRYRYSVTAIDIKGNESPATTLVLEPQAAQ